MDLPLLKRRKWTSMFLVGFGWMGANDKATIDAWAPMGVDVVIRKAII